MRCLFCCLNTDEQTFTSPLCIEVAVSIELIKINEVNNVKVGGIWNEQREEIDVKAAEVCG